MYVRQDCLHTFLLYQDPSKIVSQSAAIGKPVIFVTFNYRLNIFAFGDGNEVNIALKDQRLAIDWVTKHIAGFGGDKVCTHSCRHRSSLD